MKSLKLWWKKIPASWKEEAKSFAHTFSATLLMAVITQVQSGNIPMEKDALMALAVSCLRSAIKAAVAQFSAWINRK